MSPKSLSKVARLPIYVLQLFTSAKSFRDNPVIGSTLLNRMGLHVIRLMLAAAMTNARYLCLAPLMAKSERRLFKKNGYLLLEDFLPQESFDALNREVRGMHEVEVRQCVQGDTLTQRVLLNETVLESAPECKRLLSSAEFHKRMKYTACLLYTSDAADE